MSAVFTTSQIANALRINARIVRRWFEPVKEDSLVFSSGVQTKAWHIATFPEIAREKLKQAAEAGHFRDAESLLSSTPVEWQPAIPLSELDGHCTVAAVKLQRALLPSIQRRNDLRFSATELDRIGIEDYSREFGHTITARYFRELLKRTLDRDGGAENWARLEIYLPGQLKRKFEPKKILGAAGEEMFRELHDVVATFKNPADPSSAEITLLWLRSFEVLVALVGEGRNEKKTAIALKKFLWSHAAWLANSANALRVQFDAKLKQWREGVGHPDSLADGREQRRGISTAKPFNQESIDKITWHAVANCGGRISQAVRQLVEEDQLDPDILRCFIIKRASKSYVPNRLREAVRYDVEALLPIHQGPRAADKLIPSLDLKYDGAFSMQCVQADDFTMPVYFYVPDGQGWFRLTRGQVLLAIDWRSLRILGFCLYPEGQYNSRLIRTLFTCVFDEHGLPKILYLERGIWKSSKLITGDTNARREDLPFSQAEVETGLRQFGIEFKHARRARSKPVERVGGLLQDLMEGDPGYCGRMEMKDCPEITTRHKRLVESKQKHPADLGLYSVEQWEARLEEICARYNRSEQDGKRLAGMSPDQAFEHFWNRNDPPTKYSAEHRYLLAHHKIPVQVNANKTIQFRVRSESYKFFDAQIGARAGQKLIAWFNPEAPEFCTFTDHNMRNAFTVARHTGVNGLFTDEVFEAETARAHGAAAPSKARYKILKSKFAGAFRPTISGRSTADLGEQMAAQSAAIQTAQRDRQTRVSAIRNKARDLGVPSAVLNDNEDTRQALDNMAAARRENAQAQTSKTYHLKPFGNGQREYVDYLISRLTEFRKVGKSFGQDFVGPISSQVTHKIVRSQLGFDPYDDTRFEEVCAHLKEKIDATILGKRNKAKGSASYHSFEEHAATQPEETP